MTFNDLVYPHTQEEFIRDVACRHALCVGTSHAGLARLFSWKNLNDLLAFSGINYPQLRLIKDGAELPPEVFMKQNSLVSYSFVSVEATITHMKAGATLVVEAVHRLHEGVGTMCEAIERSLGVFVQADLYACTSEVRNSLRWNEHEVFILQSEGSTILDVRCPSVQFGDAALPPSSPVAQSSWSGTLNDGDLFYLPGGWWYQEAIAGPSILVVFKYKHYTVWDAMNYFMGSLNSRELTKVIFRPGDESACEADALIRQTIDRGFLDAGVIHNCIYSLRFTSPSIVRFNFPYSGRDAIPPEEYVIVPLVRFLSPQALQGLNPSGSCMIVFDGNNVDLASDDILVVEELCRRSPITIKGLCDQLTCILDQNRVLSSLSGLHDRGVISFSVPSDPR